MLHMYTTLHPQYLCIASIPFFVYLFLSAMLCLMPNNTYVVVIGIIFCACIIYIQVNKSTNLSLCTYSCLPCSA